MVRTPKYLLAQERLSGSLAERLTYWRDHGVPFVAMARMLHTETGVEVTGQTISDWFAVLDRQTA